MKILLIRGNPRKNGACDKLADLFAEGLREGGAEICDISLRDKKISPCRGCFFCSSNDKAKCIISDQMSDIGELFSSAPAVVLVSPIYFHSPSALIKTFMERLFPFVRGYEISGREKIETSFKIPKKKLITISASLAPCPRAFGVSSAFYSENAASLGFEYCADIRRGESLYFGMRGKNSLRIRKILSSYREAGFEFASTGKISEQTISKAEERVGSCDSDFSKGAKIYWKALQNSAKKRRSF